MYCSVRRWSVSATVLRDDPSFCSSVDEVLLYAGRRCVVCLIALLSHYMQSLCEEATRRSSQQQQQYLCHHVCDERNVPFTGNSGIQHCTSYKNLAVSSVYVCVCVCCQFQSPTTASLYWQRQLIAHNRTALVTRPGANPFPVVCSGISLCAQHSTGVSSWQPAADVRGCCSLPSTLCRLPGDAGAINLSVSPRRSRVMAAVRAWNSLPPQTSAACSLLTFQQKTWVSPFRQWFKALFVLTDRKLCRLTSLLLRKFGKCLRDCSDGVTKMLFLQ